MNHQELFTQFCSGTNKSVEQVYKSSFSTVEKLILKNSGTKKDAEDIFQEALIALLGYCKKDFTLTIPLPGFVYSISRNLWLRNLKKNKPSGITFIDIEEYTVIESPFNEKDDSRKFIKIFKHINRLPEKGRQIIKDFYIEGKSLDQIAEELGYANKESLKVQKSKHLSTLRKFLKSDEK